MKLLECPKLEAVNHLLSIRTGDCIIDGRLPILCLLESCMGVTVIPR